MITEFTTLLTAIADIENGVHRQYILAEVLAEIKSLESANRDRLANSMGAGKHIGDHFTVMVKYPEVMTVNQDKVGELIESGWPLEAIEKTFPIKYGLNKKALDKTPSLNYAIATKTGKPTVKITLNENE
jgi:hypothetical protein